MTASGANPGQPRREPPPRIDGAAEETFEADVIGVDVIGFSRFTQSLVDKKGAGAAEEVRDVLDVGFRAVADRLKDDGFAAVDSIGDGIVLARPAKGVPADLALAVRRAEQAFAAALGALRVRAAHASGKLSLCRIGGLQQRWDLVATGPAIEALHAAIRQKRELEPVRSAAERIEIAPLQSVPHARSGEARPISEIRRLAVAFVALKPPPSMLSAPLATLQDIAVLGQGLAEAWGGQLEKVTHDDKGLLFDFAFARTRDVGVTALDSALDFILDLQPLLAERGFSPRFGLAEGMVYRGALALGERTIPIVHGPAVNLGAKLAALGEAELALDWTAAQKLVARFADFATGVERELPGGQRYVGFALSDVLGRPARKKSSALVGRSAELALLKNAIVQLGDGIGGLILLSGPQGIGKSKLIDALHAIAPPSVHAYWLRADPRRASEHMSLWRDVARRLALSIAGTQSTIAGVLTEVLTSAGVAEELLAIINDVVPDSGLKPTGKLAALEGIPRRELLERAIVALAVSAASRAPTMLCLDDAHWFDDASSRVLAAVLHAAPQLLVVLTHRGGEDAGLDPLREACIPERTLALTLQPLARDDIKAIARAASPVLAEENAALDQIFNLSGGNPLHAEQIAHLLQERLAKSLAALARDLAEGPDMIEHVLDERLDGLSPAETQIVRTLSIFDRPLSQAALQSLTRTGAVATADALTRLSAHAFIELGDAQTALMKNRLLSKAVVDRIPPREVQTLHAGAARFVGRLRAGKQDPSASDALIAHHWRAAGERRRAAVAFGKSGDGVLYAGAPDLAITFYRDALAALAEDGVAKTLPRVAGWHAGLAVAHWARGEMHEALADAGEALALIDMRIGGPRWLPRALRKTIARTRRAVLAPTFLRKRLVPRDVRAPLVTMSAIRAEMAFFLADPGAVISASASMIAFADEPRLRARARARAYLFVGHSATLLDLNKAALGAWNRARAIGEAANDPVASSHGYLGEAIWHMSHGRWAEATRQLELATELYGDVADPAYHKFVETLLALGAYFRGDWQACDERFAALHAVGLKQGNRSTEAWGLYGQAEALIIPGRWDEAEKHLAGAEPIVESMPDRQSLIICKGVRTHLEFGRRRLERALDRALDCLGMARALSVNNFGSLEGFAAPAEVLLRLALDEEAPAFVRASARANIKAALKALRRFAKIHPIARPRLRLCEALAARLERRAADADKLLHEGLALAQAMGMQFERHKLEAALAAVRPQG